MIEVRYARRGLPSWSAKMRVSHDGAELGNDAATIIPQAPYGASVRLDWRLAAPRPADRLFQKQAQSGYQIPPPSALYRAT